MRRAGPVSNPSGLPHQKGTNECLCLFVFFFFDDVKPLLNACNCKISPEPAVPAMSAAHQAESASSGIPL